MNKRVITKRSETDWNRVDSTNDKDTDTSDIPEIPPEMFSRSLVRRGLKPITTKQQLTIRVDREVLDWYKQQGRGYQTKINSLLRAYMDAHKA